MVWTLNPQQVVFIGRLLTSGTVDLTQKVAVAGSDVKSPQYVETIVGVNVEAITVDNISNDNSRFISGNVLTGSNIGSTGYVGFFDHLLSHHS